ncbi:nucleic acid-binding, OB-fold protein [Tanacetum coccineum]
MWIGGHSLSTYDMLITPKLWETIFRDHAFILEFEGATSVRKASGKDGGFVRYPFQLQEIGNIELMYNKYLIGPLTREQTLKLWISASLIADKLYLSSSSSTQILNDPQIPSLKALKVENRRPGEGEVSVKIDNIKTRKGWNFPSCGGDKCKKGIARKERCFWCEACNKNVKYLVLRFRLELDVSDKTASTVVVMFDEPATELVKCSADSIMEADDEMAMLACPEPWQTSLAPCTPWNKIPIHIINMVRLRALRAGSLL